MTWPTALAIITASRRIYSAPRYTALVLPVRTAAAFQLSARPYQSRVNIQQHVAARRDFHASAIRSALPILPLLVLKSSSILPATITVARVMLSFFPFITMLNFRKRRHNHWYAKQPKPCFSPVAEAFVDKWCPNETGKRFTFLQFTTLNRTERSALIRQIQDSPRDPPKVTGDGRLHFLLPALPPPSLAEYSRLSVDEKEQVYLCRRHRVAATIAGEMAGRWKWLLRIFAGLPVFVILVAILAALERVPITGRWRIILMSPDEEDAISTKLVGEKWYQSVMAMLSTADEPAPPIVPLEDWRWSWVREILLRLEAAAVEDSLTVHGDSASAQVASSTSAMPPPAAYPFKPRPRASASLHSALPGANTQSGKEHLQLGPPFSLLLLEKDEANAFSYGFGGKGAGGIVVYTGLLDNILAGNASPTALPPKRTFWLSFSSLFAAPSLPTPAGRSAEQDFHLATVVAHELGHLLLSHHLETLSSRQVLWPSVIGLATDIVRVVVWPVTVLFGPLLNDGLSNISKASVNLLKDRVEVPLSRVQELEADLVGLRLLARAGFNAESAVDVWGDQVTSLSENMGLGQTSYRKHWADPSQSHPEARERVAAVREELARWEVEST